MNDLLWVIQSVNNYLLSIYYMPATMYPEDTMNQKGVCSHEAYILMGETKTVEKKKE